MIAKSAIGSQPIARERAKQPLANTETASNTKADTEKALRVEKEGRVGRDPLLRETTGGTLIAKFPLAEHPDGREGDQVKVIGYRNDRKYNGKMHQKINAVVVKPPKASTQ